VSESQVRIEALVADLCSPVCAGRRTGTPGGRAARELVRGALEKAGLVVAEQPIPQNGGANLVASIEGSGPLADRTILVGAHYDHLGTGSRGEVYHGADDNAAAVAVLVETARTVARERGAGRRVLVVAFDAEEPPFFGGPAMGSEVLAESGLVALDRIDAMVAMDLVGHELGPEALPDTVRRSLFVLGAEKGAGLAALVDARARKTAGLIPRRLDAEVIPPLSDYEPFWERGVPFLFLTCGRSSVYHTPQDLPGLLGFAKIDATARFLAGLTLDLAAGAPRAAFAASARDDAATLANLLELGRVLAAFSPEAAFAVKAASELAAAASKRPLTPGERDVVGRLIAGFEQGLA
jgi:hypothetical protein